MLHSKFSYRAVQQDQHRIDVLTKLLHLHTAEQRDLR